MAKSKNNTKKMSYISVPSQIINSLSTSSLQSLLLSPKKSSRNKLFSFTNYKSPRLWFFTLFFFCLFGMLKLGFHLEQPLIPFSTYPCATTLSQLSSSNRYLKSKVSTASGNGKFENVQKNKILNGFIQPQLLISNGFSKAQAFNGSDKEKYEEEFGKSEFWRQPDGLGYRSCLDFSKDYRRTSEGIVKDRSKYLMVVLSGGMNQQRNQIVDAVVIARILGAALVVPILQVNIIWGDESEFSDIFDLEHFKSVLANDVRVVSSLPSTHIMKRPVERTPPLHVTPRWIRSRYLKQIKKEEVLLLRGLESRLSKDLPSDLQKLRCKVAFHALRFAPPIFDLGNKLAQRMRSKGPYLALHLRMEKDVWVRTGCLPGLSHEYDEIINNERQKHPELLTARSNMTYHDRRLAGLCPLNAMEVTRLLKSLGAPKDARIYWAGGQPLGGKEALDPLKQEFPHFYNKEDLALPGELKPFAKRASLLAALDYIVSEKSDVFMPSHGGNMGHALQGHRAYAGYKKYITPNKRHMLPYFLNSSLPEAEFNRIIRVVHRDSLGKPELKISKARSDVTKYPVPECMCKDSQT
ncbi:O-fucosyltransferase family protein [Quillaja saponaria]|uniref:O-fucosyltransferase family protein n=1 Tax=Quillaja saponaria TaxID=32244 RepID=A0AAD7PBW2_QUISA|nr:O-fucosyltransferase family protein [Quillaja saponaria]